MKVRYNQVFGYYIEITKTHLSRVPPDFIRKQTLVNAERFMTPELKELEERVTGAEIKLLSLEQELFEQLRVRLANEVPRLQAMAQSVALLDVLAGLAETAALYRYVKPLVDESSTILIREGRHPVVEQLSSDLTFVPNDTALDCEGNRLVILTGPNMAGKSTYLRQVALIVLLAQIGSFVPATEARIGLVDRIFTRVGASDNLAAGQSTFMVEMIESAHILNSATARSLILLDEIGRGTSTYDGLSIAWAIAEHIQDRRHLGARTLFATHYHEMTQLERLREGIRNYCVAVQERDGDVVSCVKLCRAVQTAVTAFFSIVFFFVIEKGGDSLDGHAGRNKSGPVGTTDTTSRARHISGKEPPRASLLSPSDHRGVKQIDSSMTPARCAQSIADTAPDRSNRPRRRSRKIKRRPFLIEDAPLQQNRQFSDEQARLYFAVQGIKPAMGSPPGRTRHIAWLRLLSLRRSGKTCFASAQLPQFRLPRALLQPQTEMSAASPWNGHSGSF